MKPRHPDVYIGGGAVALGLVGLFLVVPREIDAFIQFGASPGMSPRVFPQVALIALAGLGLMLVVTRLRTGTGPAPDEAEGVTPGGRARALAAFAVMGLYAVLMEWLGYLLLTPLAIVALGALFGERRWLRLAAVAVATTAVVWAFFRYLLFLVLPEGTLFTHGLGG